MRSRSWRGSGLVATLAAFALVAGACGGDDDSGGAGDVTTTTAGGGATTTTAGGATTTSAGGTATTAPPTDDIDPDAVLRIGFNFLRSGRYNFDPRLYAGNLMSMFFYQLYAPLVKVDPASLTYTPYLAESFEVVDPQTLSVTIRSDATFHDGRPVTAADAKASIETTKANQAEGTANVNQSIRVLESVEVVDEQTFVVHFGQPAVLTMYELMAGPEFLIAPADAGPEQATQPIGNGPFAFVSGAQDQSFTLEKYDGFFDADSIRLGGLEYYNLTEGNAQVNALLAGDIDVATDTGSDGPEILGGRDDFVGLSLLDSIRYLYATFCFAPGHFWENPELIQAAKYATDRQQIVDALYNGRAAPLAQFWPAGHPYHDPALEAEFARDVARATELVDSAGRPSAPDGFWAPASIPESQDLALLLNEQWGEAGINVEPVLSDDLTGDALQPSKTEPVTLEGGDVISSENTRAGLQRLTRQVDPASIVNTCHYRNDRLSGIIGELAALAPDDAQAVALWHEASRIALEEGPFIIFAQKPSFVGLSASVGGVEDDHFKGAGEGGFQFQEWYVTAG